MYQLHSKSVVVGINGSQAAVNAAGWAVDEAISSQIPFALSTSSGATRRNPHRCVPATGRLNAAKQRWIKRRSPCKA